MRSLLAVLLISLVLPRGHAAVADGSRARETMHADVLVVGGSQSAVAAAVQAARLGARTILLVEDERQLGGALVAGGVAAVDGNELLLQQRGMWGEFLRDLAAREPNLLRYGWVSLYTYDPRHGRAVMREWISEVGDELRLVSGVSLNKALKTGDTVRGVELRDGREIRAHVTVDATELGDLLALGGIPHRLGWEYRGEFDEPSAPERYRPILDRHPVQSLTWVFYLRDFGAGVESPEIPKPRGYSLEAATDLFGCAFRASHLGPEYRSYEAAGQRVFEADTFLEYGRVGPELYMINWPRCGNDFSYRLDRLFAGKQARQDVLKQAKLHARWFARYLQDTLGRRYGLAREVFPPDGFAYQPYYRESRRLRGLETLTEADLYSGLAEGKRVDTIAVGNYVNDHHYRPDLSPGQPGGFHPLRKSRRWGGRHTGIPYSVSYRALVPDKTDGFLAAGKSWSVSHIANGSSRMQPVSLLVGQAAGAAAALSARRNQQPFDLSAEDIRASMDYWSQEPKLPTFQAARRYCGRLKSASGGSEYSLVELRPRPEGRSHTTAITIVPEIQRFMRRHGNERICFQGVFNVSGNWMVVLEPSP